MIDYSEHKDVLTGLAAAQSPEDDCRESSRESDHFINKKDGQWEPSVVNRMTGKPRYTFDMVNSIIDQIMKDIEEQDFSITTKPASGEASADIAETYDGLIRSIHNVSMAESIYASAGRRMVGTGISGWRIVHDYASEDSFEQDLLIKRIPNFVDQAWCDPNAKEPDKSDAKYWYVLESMTKAAYDEEYPEGSGLSVSDGRTTEVYYDKADEVLIGEILYKHEEKRTLVLMSNGAVYEDNEDLAKIKDELAEKGITEQRRRESTKTTVKTRLFDGGGWLTDEQDTAFSMIPIIPCYANYEISENKPIYRSAIERLMDPQRVYNYAMSRQIEEGALAPREKYWITEEQAEGHEADLQTMNTNANPVQFYNQVEGTPPPFKQGGASINPGLQQVAVDSKQAISEVANKFAANMGNNPGLQSGVAIDRLQDRGTGGDKKYENALKTAILYTAKVLVDTIPRVYDSKRQVSIIGVDGTTDFVTLHDVEVDQETQKAVEINDLNQGTYDVTVAVGPKFSNKQEKTVSAITEIAVSDPTIIQEGADVLLKNINAPGIDTLAERKRFKMIQQGIIPENQLTDDEKEMLAQQQSAQGQQPDSMLILAQAEVEKAKADLLTAQSNAQEKVAKLQLQLESDQLKHERDMLKAETDRLKIEAQMLKDTRAFKLQVAEFNQQKINDAVKNLNLDADTLKTLKDAMGVDAIVGPGNTEAYIKQVENINEEL